MVMRSDFRRISLTLFAAAALSGSALAGFQTEQQVVMSDAQMMANGDVGYVHNTSDDVQYIGCLVAGDEGYCFARRQDGVVRTCWSNDPRWVTTMAAVSSDSYLIFYWNTAGYCTGMTVRNESVTAPKN
jgi:hypothetical protein